MGLFTTHLIYPLLLRDGSNDALHLQHSSKSLAAPKVPMGDRMTNTVSLSIAETLNESHPVRSGLVTAYVNRALLGFSYRRSS